MTKILIINMPGLANRGSMGVVMGAIAGIHRYFPQAHITFLCHRFDPDRDVLLKATDTSNISIKKHPWYKERNSLLLTALLSGIGFILMLLQCFMCQITRKLGAHYKSPYHGYDVIIDLNTDSLNDYYQGVFAPLFVLANIILSMCTRSPVVICASSVGPFKNKAIIFAVRKVLNKASLITVREEFSKGYLKSIGINKPLIEVTMDLALLLEPSDIVDRDAILDGVTTWDKKLATVAICPVHNIPIAETEQHISLIANLSDSIVEKYNVNVILITHEFFMSAYTGQSEVTMINARIRERTINKQNIAVINGAPSASQLKTIIGGCDVFISFVFHPIIAALSMGVPSIAISWYGRHKFHGLIGRELDQDDYIIDVDLHTVDWKEFSYVLQFKFESLWTNKITIKEQLLPKIALAKKRSFTNVELIKDTFESRTS